MPETQNTKDKTRIVFVGKFQKLHDEEYIARSFEALGCEVLRIEEHIDYVDLNNFIKARQPAFVLYTKWDVHPETLRICKLLGVKTVCWVFDLYFGYTREYQVRNKTFFKSEYVFTTDNGHPEEWKERGINHQCVRQGIYAPECKMLKPEPDIDVVFVGSESPVYPERNSMMVNLSKHYNFRWFGRRDTNEVRGEKLNILFSRCKIVVGDSYFSPNYWSNRIVETLGRGGFLIHKDVPGLKEEYPDIVTYDGTLEDLMAKIDYYLSHEAERLEIVKKNFELVKSRYTMEHKCQDLLNSIS